MKAWWDFVVWMNDEGGGAKRQFYYRHYEISSRLKTFMLSFLITHDYLTDGQQNCASRSIFISASIACRSLASEAVKEYMQNGTRRTRGSSLMRFKCMLQPTAAAEGRELQPSTIQFNSCSYLPFREYYRATSKRPDASTIPAARDQNAQASNLVPSMSRYKGVMSNEINPPEVLLNRDAVIQNKLRRNKKQQISRGREHKSLNLTGNVDLGSMNLKQNKLSRRRNGTRRMSTTTTTTTQHPNTISEIFQPNHHSHRHNHYDNREEKDYRKPEPAPTPYPVTYRPETSTTKAFIVPTTTTALPSSSDNTTQKLSKEAEKVIKRFANTSQSILIGYSSFISEISSGSSPKEVVKPHRGTKAWVHEN